MSLDSKFMNEAIRLARRGIGQVSPNPCVGAIVVRDGDVVGRGWYEGPGAPHAEIVAIDEAGADSAGSTVYVSLEPCTHHGNTSPCVDALIDAGVARVVVAIEDPDQRVDGRGIKSLRGSGIDVAVGVGGEQAAGVNREYLVHRKLGRPFVICKVAASMDGRVAAADGNSRWITSEASRLDVHRLRSRVDAVCVGVGTVVADDPMLTVRDVPSGRQPLRVVVDSSGRTPEGSKVLSDDAETLIVTTKSLPPPLGPRSIFVDSSDGRVDLPSMLSELASRDVVSLLVEGGPTLLGSFVREDLVDRFIFYLAPKLLGDAGLALLAGWAASTIDASFDLDIESVRKIGDDICVVAQPALRRT